MPRVYVAVQCLGYSSTYELQGHVSRIIEQWQKEGYYAEVHYAINNTTASAMLLKYEEDDI